MFEQQFSAEKTFTPINEGYNNTFKPNHLSLGLVVPLETYSNSPVPHMTRHIDRVQLADELGFSSLWLRDVPFNVPSFGDAGQVFDPFVYLGMLAAKTERIALGVASIVLPLRHPAHVAKAAASIDILSNGRLILGVASGDRPEEYPALNQSFEDRGDSFRDSFEYICQMSKPSPQFNNHHGSLNGSIDMLPKPTAGKIPLLITGGSQQEPEWLAQNGDGWMTYPRDINIQSKIIHSWRERIKIAELPDKPAMQSLYIDLLKDDNALPQPIHLGFRLGINALREHLRLLQKIGINHVALNLRYNQTDIEQTLKYLGNNLFPEFN